MEVAFPGGSEGEYMMVTQGEHEMGIRLELDENGMAKRIDLVMT